jgi:hypothetical protein
VGSGRRGQLHAAATAFLATCEQVLDEPALQLIESAAASLRAAAGDLAPPAPAPRRSRKRTP